MESMHHWVPRLALVTVLLASGVAFITFMFNGNNYQHIWVLVGAIALIGLALLYRGIRRDGWGYPVRLLLSVRMRLTIWYVAVLALVLAVFAVGIYFTQQTYLYDDLNKQLDARLQQIAATYDPETNQLNYQAVDSVVPSPPKLTGKTPLDVFPSREIVLLLAPDGTVLQQPTRPLDSNALHQLVALVLNTVAKNSASFDTNNDGTYPAIQMTLSFDLPSGAIVSGRYSVTSVPIVRQQRTVAFLVVGVMNDVPGQLTTLQSALLTFAPLVLFIAAIGGFWLAGLSMRPVQTITHTAQHISESDLSRRLRLHRRDELGELADTFDLMLDRLEAAFTRQARFTADASHELRTPLTIVNLETNRLLARPQLSPEQRQSLITIQQENSAMTRLIHGLLLLARADSGTSIVRHEQVDLGEVVLEVVERLAPLARDGNLQMIVAPLPDLTIRGDRVYLVQMLGNIVENALKYSSQSGTSVQVALEHSRKQGDDWAVLRVQDDGPGIADEHLPHLFERFYRVDTSRTHNAVKPGEESATSCDPSSDFTEYDPRSADIQAGGNGLGLAIAQWIAEAHGGKIQVHSQVGTGTTFEILLPYS